MPRDSKLWGTFFLPKPSFICTVSCTVLRKLLDKYDLYYFIQHILLSMTSEICLLLTSTLTVWHSRTRSREDKGTNRRKFPLNVRKHYKGNQALAEVTQTGCESLWDIHKSSGCGLALGDSSWTGGLDQMISLTYLVLLWFLPIVWAHSPDACWYYPVVPWLNLSCWYMAP